MSPDMGHQGSLYDHCGAMLDLWQTGLEIFNGRHWLSEDDKQRKKELEGAVKLLRAYMVGDADSYFYMREINNIPSNPNDIKD